MGIATSTDNLDKLAEAGETMTKVIPSLIATYILNLIDYWQTMYAVRLYGIGVEINPIARFLIETNYGWVVKFIIMPILLTIVGILVRTDRKMAWVVYAALVWYIAIVAHNCFMLLRI